MHRCKPKIQPVLLWSHNYEFVERGRRHINTNFIEKFYAITINDLSLLVEDTLPEKLEEVIEQYDFTVIKIWDDHFELILLDNQRHKIHEIDDFERALEILIKKIPRKLD